ncbi:TPA: MBL fold metallo-hydrolase [Vibrio vulnificus]|uniref:MBL fold metallo-hydrolase n=1 Tax=Vibrio vulnificus TaxID=672 RepID=UPI001A18A5A3|nr:MBL fold metallo-hydrolase [Vibrio vulnificus]EJU9785775.1 MBL fold metallo-hydrolase [Vibrio vulnificus]MCA3993058.1 MBL fold metallo-hydrolase [Vibrio vulnificus]HAS6373003.1 MBL fold metallo-hydrolase [Vibrio vulnificus]HAS8255011.1 MBL fold metallo-hydrolase [Vibrio vulnificus]HDY7630357.1 MBL fold metallo-hydrolase [Vibrio vulnificus]
MRSEILYEEGSHRWLMFGRDPHKPDKIIDTNQYMLVHNGKAMLLDPGGIELFSAMLSSVVKEISLEQITHLFASHQDPDIISSLGLWDKTLPSATLHSPWLWEGFIRHFGMESITFAPIKDQGGTMSLAGLDIQFIPAHYMHSSGNFSVYDPEAKILMSGDIGAALDRIDAPLFVEDFGSHIEKMAYFHQRWMPSEKAKSAWIDNVSQLDIEMMCPQHGGIFRGDDVPRFLDWLDKLEVGIAV